MASILGSVIVIMQEYVVMCSNEYKQDIWASESWPSGQSRPVHDDHI